MAKKKIVVKDNKLKIAHTLSALIVIFLSSTFIFEARLAEVSIDYPLIGSIAIAAFIIIISIIRTTINTYKLASNIPMVLFLFYTSLMAISRWELSAHFLFVCLAFCAISCLYSSFYRTLLFMIFQNLFIGYLVINGVPISGSNIPLIIMLGNWFILILTSIIMLVLTRVATIVLDNALEHRNSFRSLLASTENYIAMIDESNRVVYASKTLAQLGKVNEEELVQGRPLIDLFPGRSLKLFAGKLLKSKDNYAEDWEFTLDGQKRYFKTTSHSLPGSNSGALVSLYDMTHLAERDEIAAMKDSMKIGLFFMDKECIIQDHYSQYLEELLSEKDLNGKLFTDVIADSVTPSEIDGIKDYFEMVREGTLDEDMLNDINPLNELHYVHVKSGNKKVLQCEFNTIMKGAGEIFLLVTVYDITARVELQERLAEEEAKRQEEMQSMFELLNCGPGVFSDFMADMEAEMDTIDQILKDENLSGHEALVKVYQSVHAIKSNAVVLGLSVFGNKVHNLETKIKKLRETEGEIPFADMLNFTMDIEKLYQEKEGFKDIIDKLQIYTGGGGENGAAGAGSAAGGTEKQNIKALINSLVKTTEKASQDEEKTVKFSPMEMEDEAYNKGPRRIIKEILMQLIRNSVVHGIEKPDVRLEKGKKETGNIRFSIKITEDKKHIHIKLSDDGKGLDYEKIKDKALKNNIIKPEDANNKNALIKAIFSPGFSTAETEGVHAGRGIGLNLVRDRVNSVKGTIKLNSEIDKGTVFFISIPVQEAASK